MTVLALATYFSSGDTALPAVSAVDPRAEERALVARAQAGDLPAFEALYRRNVQRVCALCFRLADDAAAAEELVQEVFARAWMSLSRFRSESAFASWLHPIAVRLALDDRRARRHGPLFLNADDPIITEAPGSAGNPEAGFDLERALRALPPGARAVFVLHDIEGHRHEDIAAMMGVDPGTSKSQLHRARKLLREALR